MKKKLSSYFLFVFFVVGVMSCKKDKTSLEVGEKGNASAINKTKDWYEAQLNTNDKETKTNIGFLKKEIDWSQQKDFTEQRITLVPYKILGSRNCKLYLKLQTNEKGEILSGEYLFLLSKGNINEDAVENIIKNINLGFNGTVIKYSLNNELISADIYKNNVMERNSNSKIITKLDIETTRPIDEVCNGNSLCLTYWWCTYDSAGNIATATYLYTVCVCGGDNESGSGNQNGDVFIDAGTPASINSSFVIVHKTTFSEDWFVSKNVQVNGMKFVDNSLNYFTNYVSDNNFIYTNNYQAAGGYNGYPLSSVYCYATSRTATHNLPSSNQYHCNAYLTVYYPNYIPTPYSSNYTAYYHANAITDLQ